MFRGINAMTIDAKGRLSVPTRYRDTLLRHDKGHIVITIDTDETCLLLYPKAIWLSIEKKLQALPSFNTTARRVQRLLIGHATDVQIDNNGRLLLPPILREYAKLEKKIVMIGQGHKFEVWNEAIWQAKRHQWIEHQSTGGHDLPDEMKSFSL